MVSESTRIGSIDTARFLAIALVFYGHFVEQVMYLDNAAAAAQYKWIYSFHMPLFYVLSGIVHNEARPRLAIMPFLHRVLRSRLVPYGLFALLPALFVFAGVPGWFPTVDLSRPAGYVEGFVSTLMGLPAFNIPLWFLASLVLIELLHFAIGRLWTTKARLLAGIVVFYLIGYLFNRYVDVIGAGLIFWMAHVVPLGYAFYLTGILVRRTGILERSFPTSTVAAVAGLCLVGVFLSYDLNQGPFRLLDVVVMMFGTVGHPILFPLTALVGSALVILIARLMPAWRWLQYLGEITLLIYCLHGFFYHFVNPPLAAWMTTHLPVSSGWVLTAASVMTIALSLAITAPIAIAIQRWLPQITGRSGKVRGRPQPSGSGTP